MAGAATYSSPLITAMTPPAAGWRAMKRFRIATAAATTRIAVVACRRRRRAWDACRVTQMVAIYANRTSDAVHPAVAVADSV